MKKMSSDELKEFLDSKVAQYNHPRFIENDPISIPHRFSKKLDIEIAGLFAAVLAWGQRITIINKSNELMNLMGNEPHDFVVNHQTQDLKSFKKFKHRTFNGTDAAYFVKFLNHYYSANTSLEDLFKIEAGIDNMEPGLVNFQKVFFSLDHPHRTKKHISTPARKSACKRLNMFLRWMVRTDDRGVDFGIWKSISPAQLICPCDLHVVRVARKLKLMGPGPLNWQRALSLTRNLRKLDVHDPVKYDFALFGLGIEENF